jgi:hypothetical protein
MTRLAELRRAAECCRDVVAHAREGIAAAGPGFILVVAGDEVGADVDRQVRGWHFEVIRLAERTRSHLPDADRRTRHPLDDGGQTRDLPGSDAILLHVMWPLTPAGRQHLA